VETKNYVSVSMLLSAAIFLIPIWPSGTSILWGISILYMLITKKFDFSFARLINFKYLFPLVVLYSLHLVGMFWTSDLEYGSRDLMIKIPMIIFPFLFCFYRITEKEIVNIKNGLVLGCLTACVICLTRATANFIDDGDVSHFFYVNFSFLIFPGYFSICLNLALLILLQMMYKERLLLNKNNKYLIPLLVLFFIVNIVLISEKMSMITAILTVPLFIVLEERRKNNLRAIAKKLIIGSILFILLFLGYLKVYNRFSQVADAIKSFRENNAPRDESYYNSSTIRLAEWKYGYEIFLENWFIGVGTGDIKDECMKKYEKENFQYAINHFETPASQYLHMAMILGLFGIVVLLIAYFFPLYFAIQKADYFYVGFLLIFILNSLTGTILSGSALLLYGFFNSLLYIQLFEKVTENQKEE
jgi:O-antigen ligase